MRRMLLSFFMFEAMTMMAQSLVSLNLPIGQQFYNIYYDNKAE